MRAAELRSADAAAEVQRQQDIVAAKESELRRVQQVQSYHRCGLCGKQGQPTLPIS